VCHEIAIEVGQGLALFNKMLKKIYKLVIEYMGIKQATVADIKNALKEYCK